MGESGLLTEGDEGGGLGRRQMSGGGEGRGRGGRCGGAGDAEGDKGRWQQAHGSRGVADMRRGKKECVFPGEARRVLAL